MDKKAGNQLKKMTDNMEMALLMGNASTKKEQILHWSATPMGASSELILLVSAVPSLLLKNTFTKSK